MRIHSDVITSDDIHRAALIARVDYDGGRFTIHGSRSRARAFNVLLTGESRRRPNSGARGAGDLYAATWDQWGVFLGYLFGIDPDMLTPYYADAADFDYKTDGRFDPNTRAMIDGEPAYWPADAHGDHTFDFSGTPGSQSCTKCTAVRRWM